MSQKFIAYLAAASAVTFIYGALEGTFFNNSYETCPVPGDNIFRFGTNSHGIGLSDALISHFPSPVQDFVGHNFVVEFPARLDQIEHANEVGKYASEQVDDVYKTTVKAAKGTGRTLLGKAIKLVLLIIPMKYTGELGFNIAHGLRCGGG